MAVQRARIREQDSRGGPSPGAMTARDGEEPQGLRGVLVMTAVTAAMLSGIALWLFSPAGDATAPATASDVWVSDGHRQRWEPASRISRSDGEPPRGGMAEWYAEQQATATSGPATSVVVDTLGGMAERYRDQLIAARDTCGDDSQRAACD